MAEADNVDNIDNMVLSRNASVASIIKLMPKNSFGAAAKLRSGAADYEIFRLARLEESGVGAGCPPPLSTKILLENLLRNEDGKRVSADDVSYVARGDFGGDGGVTQPKEISFMPARVL